MSERPSESIMPEKQLLEGSCHCGAVRLTLPSAPEKATKCNCSLCRRLGGLWAYYEFGTVRVEGHPENTDEYIWGDKTLRNVRCKTCGCATHWEPLVPEPGGKQGVNLNNFDLRLRIPSITAQKVMMERGLLMSYGADARDVQRRVPSYVDRILKGAKPGD